MSVRKEAFVFRYSNKILCYGCVSCESVIGQDRDLLTLRLYPRPVQVGIMHIQLLHTSASLTINENWDPDVRDDMEMMLNRHDFCNDMWSVCG